MDLAAVKNGIAESVFADDDRVQWLITEVERRTASALDWASRCGKTQAQLEKVAREVEQLTCQKNACQQVISERDTEIGRLVAESETAFQSGLERGLERAADIANNFKLGLFTMDSARKHLVHAILAETART